MNPVETKGLMDQRTTILQRISRIEDLKSTVKPEIYEKVRKDYERQLEEINLQLQTSKEFLKMELNDCQEEKKILSDQKRVLEDELEEARFRQTIGEFPREIFEKIKTKNESELKNFESRLQELDVKIKSFKEMLEEKVPEVPLKEESLGIEIPEELGAKIDSLIGSELGMEMGTLEEEVKEKAKEEGEVEKISLDEILWDEGKLEEKEVKTPPDEPISLDESTTLDEILEPEGEGLVCPKCKTVNQADNWYCEKCGTELLVGGGG